MKFLTTAALALVLAAPGVAMAQTSGNFDVTLTVTAPIAPTYSISELDDVPFGTVDVSALNTFETNTGKNDFCVTNSNPSNLALTPKLTFSQPGLIPRPGLGSSFALLGPNRVDGSQAQLPMAIIYTASGDGSELLVERDIKQMDIPNSAPSCGTSGISYPPGTDAFGDKGKPAVRLNRLIAADGLNPAGAYRATIMVTVSPN